MEPENKLKAKLHKEDKSKNFSPVNSNKVSSLYIRSAPDVGSPNINLAFPKGGGG